MARLFISYARRDAAPLADRLEEALAGDHQVWLDRQQIEGGASWSREIEDEIDRCEVFLALLSPGAFDSPICRGEQLRALRRSKCVIPVLAMPGADRPVYLEAANFRDLSGMAYDEQFFALRRDLARWRDLPVIGAPVAGTKPERPPSIVHEVLRPAVAAKALMLLLQEVQTRAIDTTVLHGFPGTGKTALAAQLCADERVRDAFPDGVVWLPTGRDARDPRIAMQALSEALGETMALAASVERGRGALATLLGQRSVLVVLDDVWDLEQVEPFIVDAPRSRLLVTSRTRVLGPELGARQLEVPAMTGAEAAELLARWAGRADPALPAIAERLHRLPIALRIAGPLLAREPDGADWLARLEHESQLTTGTRAAGDRERDLDACLELSVRELAHERTRPPRPDDRPLFEARGIFETDTPIPCAVVKRLWHALEPARPAADWVHLLAELDELGLVDRTRDVLGMHDLLFDYCRVRIGSRAAELHERLLASYRPERSQSWSTVDDDGYLYDHLAYHLGQTHDKEAIAALLSEDDAAGSGRNAWYQARAGRGQVVAYAADIVRARGACTDLACESRFGLMLASLHSLGGSTPPALLLALVQLGVWSVDRAAVQARSLGTPGDRAEALLMLGELGASELLREAERMLPDAGSGERDYLARRIGVGYIAVGDSPAALHAANRIAHLDALGDALAQVLPAPDDADLGAAGEAAVARLDRRRRLRVLTALMQRAAGDRSAWLTRISHELQALDTNDLSGRYDHVTCGAPLVPYLAEPARITLLEQMFATLAGEVAVGVLPTPLLRELGPRLDPAWAERAYRLVRAWSAARQHSWLHERPNEAEALTALAARLADGLRREAAEYLARPPIDADGVGKVIGACIVLDPSRRDEWIGRALAILERDPQPWVKSAALYQLREHLVGTRLDEALQIATKIDDGKYRSEALHSLAERCETAPALALMVREAQRLGTGSRFEREGLERWCGIAAVVLPRLSRDERRAELAVIHAALDRADAPGSILLTWASRRQLVAMMDDVDAAEQRVSTLAVHLLAHAGSPHEIVAFAERLPRRFHDHVVEIALAHGEVGPRRQLLAALARHLTPASARRAADRLDAIGDASVRAETLTAMDAVAAATSNMAAEAAEMKILERISEDLGVQVADAVHWVHRLVATRLAAGGRHVAALDALRRVPPHEELHYHAMAEVARLLPRETIEVEAGRRPAGHRHDDLVALLGAPLADAALAGAARERTRDPRLTEYGRLLHDALFAPAVADDRVETVRRFFDRLDGDPAPSPRMIDVAARLVPYIDNVQLEHFAAAVERADSGRKETVHASLLIAARNAGRWSWACERLGRVDKPFRAPVCALAAPAFSGRQRAMLAAEALHHARYWAQQAGSVEPLCLAALVEGEEPARELILRDALTLALDIPTAEKMKDELKLVAAYAVLLLDTRRVPFVRAALERASGRLREILLRVLQTFGDAIRSRTPADRFADMGRAMADCGRWWP
jgi:hypothetical protein